MAKTQDFEFITLAVPSETRRRLAKLGFPHELEVKEVARFLIEQGIGILEKREPPSKYSPGGDRPDKPTLPRKAA